MQQSPSSKEEVLGTAQPCIHLPGCCRAPFLNLHDSHNNTSTDPNFTSTSAANRRNFTCTTTSSLFPNTRFTNHESIPSLRESFAQFLQTYPQYSHTYQIDEIRTQEYYHISLSHQVCLDYIGVGLFSFAQLHNQLSLTYPNVGASTSSAPPPPPPPPQEETEFPLFYLSYKSIDLKSELLLTRRRQSRMELEIKRRIRDFLNVSEDDYSIVLTANRTAAFKLVAESYPFQSYNKLITVYDHESEAVEAMVNSAEKGGAKYMTAQFTWPRLRINSTKLKGLITGKKKKMGTKKKRGLFVFQLQSRMTGARYSYQWMRTAQEHGWHVMLDACALGPKDMDSLGLSLFHPDFIFCSFYKIFGENPSGFGSLFVKKSIVPMVGASTCSGIVSIVPVKKLFPLNDESSDSDIEVDETPSNFQKQEAHAASSSSSSSAGKTGKRRISDFSTSKANNGHHQNAEEASYSEITESEATSNICRQQQQIKRVECRCLDQVDSLGLTRINSRGRYLTNWLINAMTKLQHPQTGKIVPLVKIYGPKVKFDRGPAVAFNIFDWKGQKVEPILVQKLADRKNLSLSYGFLQNIWFPDKYEAEKSRVLERRKLEAVKKSEGVNDKDRGKECFGIRVVTAAFGFLANFEDAYRLWAFVALFLDADFVEKERWRYTALNQKTMEI